MKTGRREADQCKRQLRELAQSWVIAGVEHLSIVAAFCEVTTDIGALLVGPDHAADLLHEMERSIRSRATEIEARLAHLRQD